MAYKYNLEMAREICEEKGYKLISSEFISVSEKLVFESQEGYKFEAEIRRFLRNGNFNYFDIRNPYTIDNIKLWLKINDAQLELLDNVFVNAKYKMKFMCLRCNSIAEINWNNIKSGRGCKPCNRTKIWSGRKMTTKDAINNIKEVNPNVLVLDKYESYHKPMLCRCLLHEIEWTPSYGNLIKGKGCPVCGSDKNSRENHFGWKGGVSPIYNYLRGEIRSWKKETIIKNNYKCDITGNRFDVVHHLYSFNKILIETLSNTNIDLRDKVEDYTDEELSIITKECLSLHNKYGVGVCLCKEEHDLFHSIYGYGGNTPEQYYEFKEKRLKQLNKEIA